GVAFGIRQRDRRLHTYCLGKTGTGKSTLLHIMLAQDIANGQGFALFDPHGALIHRVVQLATLQRPRDTVFLDIADPSLLLHFNPLANVPPDKQALAVAGLVETFKKLWSDDWGPRLEHILRNVLFTLTESPGY